jgi:tetrapyrrole methylase family protein / MazG family protein
LHTKKNRESAAAEQKSTRPSVSRRTPLKSADKRAGEWFARLLALQRRLRSPNGCPWDREQSHASLRKFLIEETYEALDAMDSGDAREFASELGDLLLQIVFHSLLAEQSRAFSAVDVIESVYTKMIRRHPHVFGNTRADSSADVLKNWEQLKSAERAVQKPNGTARSNLSFRGAPGGDKTAVPMPSPASESIVSGIPRSLPAVLEASQLTRRASHVGFDWDSLTGILEKLAEEAKEIALACQRSQPLSHIEEEAGDLLFTAVNVARFLGVDPEIALKKANQKFKLRFEWMERAARSEGSAFADLPRARKEEFWEASKREELSTPRRENL